jgi:hypothetical protein
MIGTPGGVSGVSASASAAPPIAAVTVRLFRSIG